MGLVRVSACAVPHHGLGFLLWPVPPSLFLVSPHQDDSASPASCRSPHLTRRQQRQPAAEPVRPLEWKDTVDIPHERTVRLAVHFEDRPGTWIFHCHILDHADGGPAERGAPGPAA